MADSGDRGAEVALPEQTVDYTPALRQLQTLQDQVDILRPALASIVETLTPSPLSTVSTTEMYKDFAKAARQAFGNVKKLRESWEAEQSKEALKLAQTSLQKDDELDWEFVNKGRWHCLDGLDGLDGATTEKLGKDP